MALLFHPKAGLIVVCNYETGFVKPEMVKTRTAVVITPRLRRRDGLCTVVPLSTTEPGNVEDYHYKLELDRELPKPWEGKVKWAKCDMFATVSFARLSPIKLGRGPDGQRKYLNTPIPDNDLLGIRRGVLHALSLGNLTDHL